MTFRSGGGKPNKSPSDPNNNFDGREFLHLSDVQHVREYLFILVKKHVPLPSYQMNNTAKAIFQIYCQAKIKESIRVKLFCRRNKNSIFFNAQSFFSQKNHGDGKIAGGASKGYG